MTSYQLSIITPNGKTFDGQIESLIAPGALGSFGVLGHHAPMVVSLGNGPLIIKRDGKQSFFTIASGVLEVNEQSNVIILVDSAVSVDTLDDAKAATKEFISTT